MSREGAPSNRPTPTPAAGTPIWVWLVYGLGVVAVIIVAFSLLFTLGATVLSDDIPLTYEVSWPAAVLWGGLIVAALATWFVRRRRRR